MSARLAASQAQRRPLPYTRVTLRELSERFGLSNPDSASDLIRRGAERLKQSKDMVIQLRAIESKLNVNSESEPDAS